ncbi:hypothetical protein GCN74_09760 [Janthinobacterium sp. FT14W]|uniref:hypothetical protein n=1 Tax=Janthinobacterium sp. FT14W TaxID=2654253 RepID=UPI0012646C82|nr:hypothetical protein [Janthinobacterium sp. FT14W]KAB8060233.1 hypothetical protein GCN74_09760 [Janthinobacterium sp. FT14W]
MSTVNTVSTARLYALRAMYLLVVLGLGKVPWPGIVRPRQPWELARGTVNCMLAAFSLLCLPGLRYPLRMLPVLLREALWKTLRLLLVPRPQWLNGQLDPATAATEFECGFVLLLYLAIPWRYVHAHYLLKRGTARRQLRQPCETSD